MTDDSNVTHDLKIVTFTLAGQMFGIEMKALLEIRQWEEPTPLPGVPAYVRGVTNLRGNVVPVVGLAERLGWPPSATHARSCILVCNIDGKQAGFLVDEMSDIVNISTADIQPPPALEGADMRLISGLVRVFDRNSETGAKTDDTGVMVSLIDIESLSLTRDLDAAA